jgi:2-amino-4-hydroxy-6-hydroxymethyldihydropteridine diphosphokinase
LSAKVGFLHQDCPDGYLAAMKDGIVAYLFLGSNMGDRRAALERAVQQITVRAGEVAALSSVYETEPWGIADQREFLNQAIAIVPKLSPFHLLETLLAIEGELGRVRHEKYGPRPIDIDILLYSDEVIQTEFLTVPHRGIPDRRFVLTPLAEIAPGLVHPVLRKTISELLTGCLDPLKVLRLKGSTPRLQERSS